MKSATINLLVLRACDIEAAASFYTAFGILFEKHAHGQGPAHYATTLGSLVFEIYPQAKADNSTQHVRIGFQVADAAATIQALAAKGAKIISPLKSSPWGLRAVVDDPFGHRIEIIQATE